MQAIYSKSHFKAPVDSFKAPVDSIMKACNLLLRLPE